MDGNNWRPAAQGAEAPPPTAMDGRDWRTQLQADSRQRIVNKIMETLKRHLPVSGPEGLQELRKIAVRFEEKIYAAATSQSDYLKKISLKMLTMETKSQNPMVANNKNPPDPASQSIQSQVNSQGQPLPNPLMADQAQARQQLLSQNIQNNIVSTGVQGSASLTSALPAVGNLIQNNMPNVGQNSNSQNIQSISGVTHNSVGNTMGQNMPSNMFANSQRQQMQGRQQQGVPQQQQQQPQNPQSYLYQQQFQQQIMKRKFPNIQQQQQQQQQPQQNLLQPAQLQSAQQSIMQPNVLQSTSISGNQQNQQSSVQQSAQSMLQQHQQSVLRQQQQPQQAAIVHQQQTPIPQQPIMQAQQQQHLMGQQPNTMNMQQNQLMGQQNNFPDIQQQQQQQQQQRLLGQQNNLSNLQPQQQQQQRLMGQQNNISNIHSQQLAPQNNVASLQQQQLLGTQSGNSNMLTNQHSMHILQQNKVSVQQQTQQSAATLLPTQGQQSQTQTQQQIMSQIQPQQGQLQQQIGLQQAPNSLRDMQQRLQTSSPLLQTQNIIDQQKQLYQSQRSIPEAPSTSLDSTAQTGNMNGGDWQEEVYQKIKAMKEMYGLELNEMYQRVASRLQQHESLPQQPKNEQLDNLKRFKVMVERVIAFLQLSKSNITLAQKEKISSYEKQIISFLNSSRPRKSIPSLQQGQLPPTHMNSMPPSQPPQSQITQVQPPDNQLNPQMQSMNTLSSVATVQPNNMTSLQHNSLSSLPGVSNAQQTIMNSLQSNLDPGQGNALNSLQQVAAGSLQQNSVSGPQQVNVNLSSQTGMTSLQPSLNSLQPSSNVLQQQHLKQQEQQVLQTQQLKQFQQRQIMMHKQQQQHQQQQQLLLHQQQQLHQQAKQQQQQQLGQMQSNHMSQLSQMNDAIDVKIRQQMGVKSGVFQQHHSSVQRSAYHHHPLKPGAQFPTSSPQLHQAASPQISQHHSPQTDQQHLLTSLTKPGTPLQSANSPFIPSPSTPLAPSPMPGESEKVNSNVSVLSNVGNVGPQQLTAALAPAQSLAIGTPGISASPLLAEFTSPDGNLNASVVTGRSSNTEQPLERLIKVVKSMSSQALSASVSDIGSVVSMIDRIAGSAPGNGSRAAVGEDLVAMTKCRLQARNFISQDGNTASRKIKRYTSAMPLNVVSSAGSINDSFKQLTGLEASDLESTATSSIKRPRIQANHVLLEEIREINQRLIDTVVNITDEDVDSAAAEGGEGTVVKCSFSAVALSPNLKSQYASAQMSPIQPLRLLVPTNYPNCSPILLDKFPVEISKEYEDLSMKAKSRFSISLRSLSQPMSLGEIARTWDVCARAVISEYAQQSGGGSFSSKYGTWENCLSAA